MAVEIRELRPTRQQLLKFVHFPIDNLYADNDCYVPALVLDEVNTLRPDKNPAFDFCEGVYFMAYRDGKPVGRIAGIINTVVNKRTGERTARFGFLDFIDDAEVVDALFEAVTKWAHSKQMTQLEGPLGFTDMDPEGMLVEGFDQLSTQATIYNHPYYPKHMERMGFEKSADWVEFKISIPDKIPDKMLRVADIVRNRFGLRTVHCTSRKQLVKQYGDQIFNIINESYDVLFGYSPLTDKQIQHYIDLYLPFLPLDHLCLIVDKTDALVGVGVSIPSLSTALIKSRGRYLPLGWTHLLKAIKGNTEIVDLMLVAVKPEYQNKGANALLFTDLIPPFIKRGYKWAESNPELELNQKVQQQWQYFDLVQHKRRRAYKKGI